MKCVYGAGAALVLAAFLNALGAEATLNAYARSVLADNPVVFYAFDDADPKDGGALHNLSNAAKKGPDGVYAHTVKTVVGASHVGGRAAAFEGASYVEIPHHVLFDSDDISVEFWFRSSQAFTKKAWPGSATLVTKATPGPGSGDWTILGGSSSDGANEGRIEVWVGPKGGGDSTIESPTGLNDGRFHHVAWTRTAAGQNTLYVDGVVCASKKDNGKSIHNTRPIQVGGEQLEKGGSFLKGEMAALAIYAQALSAERIHAHFAAGSVDPRLPHATKRAADFALDIKPIFQKNCHECHGLTKDKGGLSLATRARALDGGDEGAGIIAGNSALSPLVLRVAGFDEDSVMPPKGEHLSAEQVGLIRAWIDQGAVWPASADEIDPRAAKAADHWSFKALKRPATPTPKDAAWVASPIDAFILAKLDESKLRPTPPAAKEALLRRVYFDLTGLPPSPEALSAFVHDARPEAYASVVETLLASPAYGERWARHWLDVVRFAESGGGETDIYYRQAWRYRDYVIRSFNEDKPYDRFLMEQVAGDELWPEQTELMQDAVAVWTLGEWPNALDAFPDMLEYARRTDQVNTLSEAALGLTVGCANCHNHKYDPISQRDYFGLEAIFAASETWDKVRNKKPWGKGETDAFRILRHAGSPTPIRLLTRGELTKPRGAVSAALPAFLPGGGSLPSGPDESTQRRARLAKWLVSKENPLPARVIANRIWQWHFGQALALTPNDLGTQGSPPSHPELLDWLATELIESGWSLKKMHRLIVLSSTYRQSAIREPQAVATDPQDRLLSGFPRRRLEAEEVWDHLHAAAGTLDTKSFGEPFVPKLSDEELQGMYEISGKREKKWPVTADQNRRAIYILNRRSFRFPFFESFDPANNAVSCPVRQTTTVPAQALTLLNNRIVGEQAKAMAERLTRDAGPDVEKCVRLAWLLSYSREANAAEVTLALKFIRDGEAAHASAKNADPHAAALLDFCLGLINTTEFIYAN